MEKSGLATRDYNIMMYTFRLCRLYRSYRSYSLGRLRYGLRLGAAPAKCCIIRNDVKKQKMAAIVIIMELRMPVDPMYNDYKNLAS